MSLAMESVAQQWGWRRIYPAPAKLNLFLHVVGRRADGYHLLQTVFRFVDYGDRLRFSPRDDGQVVLAKGKAAAKMQAASNWRMCMVFSPFKGLMVAAVLAGFAYF